MADSFKEESYDEDFASLESEVSTALKALGRNKSAVDRIDFKLQRLNLSKS